MSPGAIVKLKIACCITALTMSFVGALIPVALGDVENMITIPLQYFTLPVTASWLATASASNLDKCSQQCDHLRWVLAISRNDKLTKPFLSVKLYER